MKILKLLLGTIAVSGLLLFNNACKKDPGPGGKAHIHGHVHYDATDTKMKSVKVEIWYDASSKPTTAADDFVLTNGMAGMAMETDGEFEFENLYKGDYYVWASGYDPDDSTQTIRTGGLAVTIKKKTEEVEADIDVD